MCGYGGGRGEGCVGAEEGGVRRVRVPHGLTCSWGNSSSYLSYAARVLPWQPECRTFCALGEAATLSGAHQSTWNIWNGILHV